VHGDSLFGEEVLFGIVTAVDKKFVAGNDTRSEEESS
jgi:hypothetical protein